MTNQIQLSQGNGAGKVPAPILPTIFGNSRRKKAIEREFDALRLRLAAAEPLIARRNDAQVVILTSRTPGEGVSTISEGLARSFARNDGGSVLLLNADSARNDRARRAPGDNATVIREPGDLQSDQAIGGDQSWGVDLLDLAVAKEDQASFAQVWQDFFSGLRARYDVIIVDAGALTSRAPYDWSDGTSQVLLVVDTDRTTVEALSRLRKELKTAKLKLGGIVLNKREYHIPRFLY